MTKRIGLVLCVSLVSLSSCSEKANGAVALGFVLLLMVGAYLKLSLDRTKVFAAVAEKQRFRFVIPRQMPSWVDTFRIVQRKHMFTAMIAERDGIELCLGAQNVEFERKHRQRRDWQSITFCAARKIGANATPFSMRRSVFVVDAVVDVFEREDINFEDDPQFSKNFVVKSNALPEDFKSQFSKEIRSDFSQLYCDWLESQEDRILIAINNSFADEDELKSLIENAFFVAKRWL
jgi:hypothetical protein